MALLETTLSYMLTRTLLNQRRHWLWASQTLHKGVYLERCMIKINLSKEKALSLTFFDLLVKYHSKS